MIANPFQGEYFLAHFLVTEGPLCTLSTGLSVTVSSKKPLTLSMNLDRIILPH